MRSHLILLAACVAALPAAPSLGQTPPPPPAAAMSQAVPYLAAAGEGDIYEVTSSQVLLDKSQNQAVRDFATMMIDHHTRTTNDALAAARRDGVTPPAPVLDAARRRQIAELRAAAPAQIDRLYLMQQQPAHQAALALHQGYAARGDRPALRAGAQAAVPIVQQHLTRVQALMAGMR